jgi:predicted amidophosphoribosyltransferase
VPVTRRTSGKSLAAAVLDLALPATCAGCGSAPGLLCATCRAAMRGPARPAWPDPPPPGLPPPWAVTAYDGVARRLVLAHKEDGRRGLAVPLGEALAVTVRAAARRAIRSHEHLLLVPMPSRAAAVRSRGHDPTLAMARRAASELRAGGLDVSVRPVLRLSRSVTDQAGLDASARAANLSGAVRVPGRLAGLLDAPVVLVDDVITTGASLAAAAEALRRVGALPVGAAVVAATARRTPGVTPDRQ